MNKSCLLTLLCLLVACDRSDEEFGRLDELLARDFPHFYTAAVTAGLDDLLRDSTRYTVFAPSESAWEVLPDGRYDSLLAANQRSELTAIVRHHIIAGDITRGQFNDLNELETIGGTTLLIERISSSVTIDEGYVRASNVRAANGFLHAVEAVLTPSNRSLREALTWRGHHTFIALIDLADLGELIDDPTSTYSVFAPTEEAFEDLDDGELDQLRDPTQRATLERRLRYHFVTSIQTRASLATEPSLPTLTSDAAAISVTLSSGDILLNDRSDDDAEVIRFNKPTTGGMLHSIDALLAAPAAGDG